MLTILFVHSTLYVQQGAVRQGSWLAPGGSLHCSLLTLLTGHALTLLTWRVGPEGEVSGERDSGQGGCSEAHC